MKPALEALVAAVNRYLAERERGTRARERAALEAMRAAAREAEEQLR